MSEKKKSINKNITQYLYIQHTHLKRQAVPPFLDFFSESMILPKASMWVFSSPPRFFGTLSTCTTRGPSSFQLVRDLFFVVALDLESAASPIWGISPLLPDVFKSSEASFSLTPSWSFLPSPDTDMAMVTSAPFKPILSLKEPVADELATLETGSDSLSLKTLLLLVFCVSVDCFGLACFESVSLLLTETSARDSNELFTSEQEVELPVLSPAPRNALAESEAATGVKALELRWAKSLRTVSANSSNDLGSASASSNAPRGCRSFEWCLAFTSWTFPCLFLNLWLGLELVAPELDRLGKSCWDSTLNMRLADLAWKWASTLLSDSDNTESLSIRLYRRETGFTGEMQTGSCSAVLSAGTTWRTCTLYITFGAKHRHSI